MDAHDDLHDDLGERLRRAADRLDPPAPAGLAERTVAAVRARATPRPIAASRWRSLALPLAACLVAGVALAAVFGPGDGPVTPGADDPGGGVASAPEADVEDVRRTLGAIVPRVPVAGGEGDVLLREWDLLVEDTRRAGSFVLACLPTPDRPAARPDG